MGSLQAGDGTQQRSFTYVGDVVRAMVALIDEPKAIGQVFNIGNGKEISIVDRKTLEIVGSIQGPGMLGGGHQIATDARGNLYVAATGNGMQKLTFKGMSSLASR